MGLPERKQQEQLILQGQLQDLDLNTLLSALRLGRQYLTLEVLDAAGQRKGTVSVKSGRILSALAGEQRGAAAVRHLLESHDAAEFRVRMQHSDAELDAEPVGTLSDFEGASNVAQLRPSGSLTGGATQLPESHGHTNGFRKTLPPPLPRAARASSTSPRRARILEGNLDEFELSHVLKVLSTSRQHFELHVRDDAAGSVGVIEVKSGVVIGASTDKQNGIAAARELLSARTGRFVAIRRAEAPADRAPLISVAALLEPPAPNDDPEDAFEDTPTHSLADEVNGEDKRQQAITVLHGKLGDLDVASILHVAGASRQYTCVHVFDDQRRPLGLIQLKSGHVVRAQAQDVSGVAAVRRLLHSPRDFSYLVQRYPNAPEVTKSIGSIANVLERAAKASAATPDKAARQPQAITGSQLTPVTSSASHARRNPEPNSNWMGGAVLGAGFVLLGGIASAVVLRSPALNPHTSVSPITAAPQAPEPLPPSAAARAEPPSEPAKPAADSGDVAPEPNNVAAPSRAAIASFQAGLRQLGYETGPIDGVIGSRTTAAIKAFQYAEHLAVDGTLSAPTRAVLSRRITEP